MANHKTRRPEPDEKRERLCTTINTSVIAKIKHLAATEQRGLSGEVELALKAWLRQKAPAR